MDVKIGQNSNMPKYIYYIFMNINKTIFISFKQRKEIVHRILAKRD